MPQTERSDRYTVRVLDRALDVLETLRDAGRPATLQELASRLRQAKSSVFRLLATLERRGYVERADGDRRYQLGAAWLTYRDGGAHGTLTEAAAPQMRALVEAFGETVNLGVLRDGEILYLEIMESPHSFRMAAAPGTRSPVHCTALGKAIAAYLPEIAVAEVVRARGLPALTPRTITSRAALRRELARTRARGYAEDNAETEPEASCIGAPILGPHGDVIGAISLSGPTSRMRPIKSAAARTLMDACRHISRALGTTAERPAQRGR